MAFTKLKAHLRARAIRTLDALWKAIRLLTESFTPGDCGDFLRHVGYFQSV